MPLVSDIYVRSDKSKSRKEAIITLAKELFPVFLRMGKSCYNPFPANLRSTKKKFFIKDFFSECNPADLVTFTEEFLMANLKLREIEEKISAKWIHLFFYTSYSFVSIISSIMQILQDSTDYLNNWKHGHEIA